MLPAVTPAGTAPFWHARPFDPVVQADGFSQLSPSYPVLSQSQPQLPPTPVATPSCKHIAPLAPAVHATGVWQYVPAYPSLHAQLQSPNSPAGVPVPLQTPTSADADCRRRRPSSADVQIDAVSQLSPS